MSDLQSWFEIAKYIGAGGAFVLGVVCWKLWGAYREEVTYSKTRDRETLTVLAAMASQSKDISNMKERREDRILQAIHDLKQTILSHNKIVVKKHLSDHRADEEDGMTEQPA